MSLESQRRRHARKRLANIPSREDLQFIQQELTAFDTRTNQRETNVSQQMNYALAILTNERIRDIPNFPELREAASLFAKTALEHITASLQHPIEDPLTIDDISDEEEPLV
jgi:hypothetical protein